MARVILAICGGFHDPQDTNGVLGLCADDPELSTVPTVVLGHGVPWAPLSAHALRQSLERRDGPAPSVRKPPLAPAADLGQVGHPDRAGHPELIVWAFSAGGVGAMALAHHWQRYRGTVRAMFLVDGWGIPWTGLAPLHRLSHDAWTHHSSRLLGAGKADFFAQPAVPHHQLWRSPRRVMGCGPLPPVNGAGSDSRAAEQTHSSVLGGGVSAASFLTAWTKPYLL